MTVIHRGETGRYYRDIPIHAAPDLHETAVDILAGYFDKTTPVLELGAGSGAFSARLTDLGYAVTPVDLDGEGWCLNTLPLVTADLNHPDWLHALPRDQYAQIVAIELVEHLENPKKFFRDLAKISPPGGRVLITTPNIACALSVLKLIAVNGFYCFDPKHYFDSGHMSILPAWLLKLFAEEAGFQVKEIRYISSLDSPWTYRWLIRAFAWLLRFVRREKSTIRGDGLTTVLLLEKSL